jgi:hypothetical protein
VGHPASSIIYITESDRGPRPPKGQSVKSGRGARSARPQRPSRRTGGDTDDHPIAPTKPLSASPHAVIQPGRPSGRRLAAAYGPRVEGPDPVDNADEQRIPRGGSLQESKFQVWPTAIRPQTPAVPGTKRPPGFGRRGGTPRSPRCGPRTSHPPQASRARPKGHSELRMASDGRGRHRVDAERSCSGRPSPGEVARPRGRRTHTPRKERRSSREE